MRRHEPPQYLVHIKVEGGPTATHERVRFVDLPDRAVVAPVIDHMQTVALDNGHGALMRPRLYLEFGQRCLQPRRVFLCRLMPQTGTLTTLELMVEAAARGGLLKTQQRWAETVFRT